MVWRANIVDEGGVFSPRMAFGGGRLGLGELVGVLALESRLSSEPARDSDSMDPERPIDRSGDLAPSR